MSKVKVSMGLDFLLSYGGNRLRQYNQQPPLDSREDTTDKKKESKPELNLELEPNAWEARSVADAVIDSAVLPRRFIDGCHYGTMVTCLKADSLRHPVPVRLAEVGGVCMRLDGRTLSREFAHVERVVCSIVDPFPWHEVEDFSTALAQKDMHLLQVSPLKDGGTSQVTDDFASMWQETYARAQEQMRILEELAVDQDPDTLSLVDGPLMRIENPLAIGVIKSHREPYLGQHQLCWRVFYNLEPGQRTPAFKLTSPRPRVSWYLRLVGAHGSMPNWGIVRVEISHEHFEQQGRDFGYLDRLSNALIHLRCR